MPKVISRSPSWLVPSSPAHRLFNVQTPQDSKYQSSVAKLEAPGLRLLAHRGSEVFVADDRTIRWADLASIKADWESTQDQSRIISSSNDDDPLASTQYKVLDLPCLAEPILQLNLSPNQKLLAVVTKHTVHVGMLPDSRRLSEPDDGPLRLKWNMVGQNAHILKASRVVRVLWHPLGVKGNTLVTITADAVVRVWELQMQNRYSFEQATMALDLRKLRNATSTKSNIEPAPIGKSEGISADFVGMDVASACFGGTGAEDEPGWSSMTLWLAMTEGDVYALCPLLPTKWQASPATISNLTLELLAEMRDQDDDDDLIAQRKWLQELESEEPREVPGANNFEPTRWIYNRPKNISTVPQIQGPFRISPGDLEGELALADIHVIASRTSTGDNDNDMMECEASLVCILTQLATVYICLDSNTTNPRWLPTQPTRKSIQDENEPELLVLDGLETFQRSDRNTSSLAGWPSLASDIKNPSGFYVTHASGIWYVTAEKWVEKLTTELSTESSAGSSFRLEVESKSRRTLRQQLIALPEREEDQPSSPLIISDSDLGYVVLTVYDGTPQAAILDSPTAIEPDEALEEPFIKAEPIDETTYTEAFPFSLRAPYLPGKAFVGDLGQLRERLRKPAATTKLNQITMTEQIRLSPAILDMMANDHRLLSEETHKLGLAISDLFTRCNMMQAEFRSQIARVREISRKVDPLTDTYDNDDNETTDSVPRSINERVEAIQSRQTALTKRFQALQAKTGNIGRPLSDKEKHYFHEVDKLAKDLAENEDKDVGNMPDGKASDKGSQQGRYICRFTEIQQLTEDFRKQINDAREADSKTTDDEAMPQPASPPEGMASFSTSIGLRVPPDIRKQRLAVIEGLLQRESALVDAVEARLESLSLD